MVKNVLETILCTDFCVGTLLCFICLMHRDIQVTCTEWHIIGKRYVSMTEITTSYRLRALCSLIVSGGKKKL